MKRRDLIIQRIVDIIKQNLILSFIFMVREPTVPLRKVRTGIF